MLDIMLPFWGEPHYLYETVQAVLGQTDPRWRLTVVDDCYPDPEVAKYFEALEDERITYVRNESNLGITQNYQKCLSLASEEHLVFLGCDDVPHPGYVARVHKLLEHFPQATIIQPGVQIIDSNGSVVRPLADVVKELVAPSARSPRLLGGESLAVSLLHADWLYWPSLVFRREVLERTPFRPGFPIIQDLALVLDIVIAGGTLLRDPEVTFSYRRHSGSASSVALFDGRRFSGEQEYFALAQKLVRKNGWKRAARAAKLHSTSRLHALTLLPTALRMRDRQALGTLSRHAFKP
ncbi:putative glycosyl transferase [Actinomyces bovis]|uniref:Glycosyl transferase n=1 Tax=Actinomyces bovis TaxID=1658 RepID=A0ABY1VMI2_9ACTO|nr:glycosyltransferase [Actinomyces bovis]SPT53314.1 putative glycosyl transferase [Actinomyces bovis]VEG52655.1 putative glycosyl transferase [Actinomyces israelii]